MAQRPQKRQRLLISGSYHSELGEKVARTLSAQLTICDLSKMANGETMVNIENSVRGKDVYIIQSIGMKDVNDALFEMQLIAYACKTAAARSIIGVMPYLPYSRQCKMRKRGAIVAKLMAQNLSKAGFCHFITVDLHQKEIQGFFECTIDNLRASPYLLTGLGQLLGGKVPAEDMVVVARNPGETKRAQSFAERLRVKIAMIHGEGTASQEKATMYKEDGRQSPPPEQVDSVSRTTSQSSEFEPTSIDDHLPEDLQRHVLRRRADSDATVRVRPSPAINAGNRRVRTISGSQLAPPKTGTMIQMTQKERPQMDVVGNVSGKTCIIVEDMLTEAEAFCISASYLKQAGANRIIVMVTHGIFVDNSIELIEQSEIDEVIVTNSVNFNAHGSSKIRMVDISGLLAEAIRRTHHGESMSFMFKNVPIED